jgi:hypothetical protein
MVAANEELDSSLNRDHQQDMMLKFIQMEMLLEKSQADVHHQV